MRLSVTLAISGLLLACSFIWPAAASADVTLPRVFGHHMVLQRDREIPVWGKASPGERVGVTLNRQQKTTVADDSGSWLVTFPSRGASVEPISMTVEGRNRISIRDILVGEVWVCAGQSNMEFRLRSASNAKQEIATADHPRIRLLNLVGAARGSSGRYTAEHLRRLVPERFCEGQWEACTSETSAPFSAVGYFFGLELHEELGVPVGLISPAIGGTPAEAWVRRAALESDEKLRPLVEGNWLQNRLLGEFCRERAALNFSRAIRDGDEIPGDESGPNHSFKPGFMWKAAIRPLLPFPIRGVIWYQGESNAESPLRVSQHERIFELLVTDWRRQWRSGDFPFLYVQLPAMGRPDWPEFREQQRRFLKTLPNTGMAITMDVGHPTNVHPTNKQPVGKRLARWALATTYRRKAPVYSGPLFRSAEVAGASLVVSFDQVGDGLASSDGMSLRHFDLAGSDGVFHAADATIVGETVVVSCSRVKEPRHARYAWVPYPDPPVNFVNAAGLPASPFTTEPQHGP
jgi:sialate O-acetylesterase